MEISLKGKTCIITGGTHGIGLVTAKLFSELGARVIALGRREVKDNKIQFVRVDLTSRQELLKFIEWYKKEVKTIDCLVNNASVNSRYSILDVTLDEWDKMLNLELTAPMLLSKMAAELMIKNSIKGKIINISAIQSKYPLHNSLPYATVKGGLISMGRSLAVDLGKYGIQVITVLPGPIYTKGEQVPEELDKNAATLLGRMGRPQEVANLLAFLASDYNTFITGTEIIIDGGRIISRKPDPPEIASGEV
ncbi:SDR family oxidoreductase [Acidianus sulfidivorans JP7]|uniref:NAD(P)-dependent oxidoreductase n=1 Tax=Acidianus sulfidivorans JP7 TaxID=619593 RepID=A0A2U9IQH6_9CREN|nr:SDR family oxidoreductase [Acidianus sulfidivorans]AWR98234.1 SDR family oxidoreductase [Acidianus sulfidivorans JP7]